MFSFPLSQMVGGIFYEHGHRLIASMVGFLTIILAGWIWFVDPRRWMRRLGVIALVTVIVQGTLGGITVLYYLPAPISIAHAGLAQIFFCLTVSIALFTSSGWLTGYSDPGRQHSAVHRFGLRSPYGDHDGTHLSANSYRSCNASYRCRTCYPRFSTGLRTTNSTELELGDWGSFHSSRRCSLRSLRSDGYRFACLGASSKQEGVDPTSRIPHSLSYCTVHVRGSHCIERETRGDQHEPPRCRSATIRYELSLNATRQPYSANYDFDTGNCRVLCLNDGVIPLVTRS